jgi:hypothetical protein
MAKRYFYSTGMRSSSFTIEAPKRPTLEKHWAFPYAMGVHCTPIREPVELHTGVAFRATPMRPLTPLPTKEDLKSALKRRALERAQYRQYRRALLRLSLTSARY